MTLAAALLSQAAGAAPRRVAILNAASDGRAGARAAGALRRALARQQPDLFPLAAGDLSRALEESLPAKLEADRVLDHARAQLDTAHRAIAQFEQSSARRALGQAEALLLTVEPNERVVKLLAEVNFQAGLVHLHEQNLGLAVDAFRQVLRLDHRREPLDPARYPPEVIQAFEAARRENGKLVPTPLEVSATFDGVPVYLDGVKIGITPLRTAVAAGPHYLLLAAGEFLPMGQKLDAVPRQRISLVVELERLPLARRATEMRRRLAAAPGEMRDRMRRAGREAALLAGVDSVLVVGDAAGTPSAAVYERNADRLSLFRPVDGHVDGLFGLLVPAPTPGLMDLVPIEERTPPTPWYAKSWVVASLSASLGATILGLVVLGLGLGPPGDGIDGRVGF